MGQVDVTGALRQGGQAAIVARKGPERLHQLWSIGQESDLFVESPIEAGDYKIRTVRIFAAKRIQGVTPSAAATRLGDQFLGFGECIHLGSSQTSETEH